MKFHIESSDSNNSFDKELDADGNIELTSNNVEEFLQKISSWGRFEIYPPGTKIYFDKPSHPTFWTLYFQNGYD